MAQLGGHAQFIESQDHPDRPRRHGQGDRRDPRPLQRRDRHPPVRLGNGQQVHPRRGRGQPRAGAQHAVRRLPPPPGAGRPHDDHRALRRSSRQDRDRQLGPRPRATLKPISVAQSLVLLLPRFGMNVRLVHPPEFKLMPDIVEQAQENARRAHVGFEIMDDFDEGFRGTDVVYAKSWGAMLTTTDEAEDNAPDQQVPSRGSPTRGAWRSPTRTRCSCTRCRPTATSRSPTR